MGCRAGYPKEKCPFGHDKQCNREHCSACVNFVPPPHILAWCSLYDRDKIICRLPKSACGTCAFKFERAPGRPSVDGLVDWTDPISVAKYQAEWKQRHADYVKAASQRFLAKNPDYFKSYYEKNKDKLKRARQEKREQSKSKV